jgi:hypothetical protein
VGAVQAFPMVEADMSQALSPQYQPRLEGSLGKHNTLCSAHYLEPGSIEHGNLTQVVGWDGTVPRDSRKEM